jgi:hypothetical protein
MTSLLAWAGYNTGASEHTRTIFRTILCNTIRKERLESETLKKAEQFYQSCLT